MKRSFHVTRVKNGKLEGGHALKRIGDLMIFFCFCSFASENLLTSHQRVVHLKKYSKLCEVCGQSIPNSETFKRHMEKHEGITEPTLSCEICGRLVGSKHSLRVHMKSIHPEDGKHEYICHVCLKVSPNKRALREHIRRVHASGYNHKCTICEKAFKRMDHLKVMWSYIEIFF